MRSITLLFIVISTLSIHFNLYSQHLTKNDWHIGIFAGTINYQGDLKPNSFTFNHENPAFKAIIRKPLNDWSSIRLGAGIGEIEGADRDNRNYLKTRNLSFHSDIKEVFAELELRMTDLSTSKLSPYVYGGVALFHFNPWTFDKNGVKTFLKPLSTEGQGLPDYPDQKPYELTQIAFAFGAGLRVKLNPFVNVSLELSQRKSFIDYLDDVSTHYVDPDKLLAARGPKAVALSYRGDEFPNSVTYPPDGEQRGTANKMDWYYYFGFTFEFKLIFIKAKISGWDGDINSFSYFNNCPKVN